MAPEQQSLFDTTGTAAHRAGPSNMGLFPEAVFEEMLRRVPDPPPGMAAEAAEKAATAAKLRGGPASTDDIVRIISFQDHAPLRDGPDLVFPGKERPACRLRAGAVTDAQACALVRECLATGIEWAVLTDGRRWRLYRATSLCAPSKYIELSVKNLRPDSRDEAALFIYLFTPYGYGRKPSLIERTQKQYEREKKLLKKEYSAELEKAALLLCRGFVEYERGKTGAMMTESALNMVYKHSLILLHRMIYVLFAEAQDGLPGAGTRYYTEYGLSDLLERYTYAKRPRDGQRLSFNIFRELEKLWLLLHTGSRDLHVPCLAGELFDPQRHPFLKSNFAPDFFMREVLALLAPGGKSRDSRFFSFFSAADVIEMLAPLTRRILKHAVRTQVLIREGSGRVWVAPGKAKWKESYGRVKRGELYLDDSGAQGMKPYGAGRIAVFVVEAFGKTRHGASPALVAGSPEAPLMLLSAISAMSLEQCGDGAGYDNALRRAVASCYAACDTLYQAELARLGVWLLTLDGRPPAHLEHNIICADSICTAAPDDIERADPGGSLQKHLAAAAADTRAAAARGAGNRSDAARRINAFARASSQTALINKRVNTLLAARAGNDILKKHNAANIPVCFPEVFYGGGAPGFALILACSRCAISEPGAAHLARKYPEIFKQTRKGAALAARTALLREGGLLAAAALPSTLSTKEFARMKEFFDAATGGGRFSMYAAGAGGASPRAGVILVST